MAVPVLSILWDRSDVPANVFSFFVAACSITRALHRSRSPRLIRVVNALRQRQDSIKPCSAKSSVLPLACDNPAIVGAMHRGILARDRTGVRLIRHLGHPAVRPLGFMRSAFADGIGTTTSKSVFVNIGEIVRIDADQLVKGLPGENRQTWSEHMGKTKIAIKFFSTDEYERYCALPSVSWFEIILILE